MCSRWPARFPEYFSLARGCGNFLSFGVFPETAAGDAKFLPGGVQIRGQWQKVDPDAVTEEVGQSRFSSASGLKPFDGETVAAPEKNGAYSWLKAPRYQRRADGSRPAGARARGLSGRAQRRFDKARWTACSKRSDARRRDLASVMGRHAARALECKLLADRCAVWLDQLTPDAPAFKDFSIPESGHGCGLTEAARGALGHWLGIEAKKISNYQCVVPTTWNCSPRDDRGVPGPVEQALVGVAVADAENPVEVARVVRSFDPCLACAVH